MHILIVEDDPIMRKELQILLENALYQVTALETFAKIAEAVGRVQPDLVLLDVNLPGVSGFEVCTRIRGQSQVPVIFLTGRTDSMDELNGMLKGGDDYIVKPYQASILLARIAAVLKRAAHGGTSENVQGESGVLTCKGICLDLPRCCLTCGEGVVELTKSEMKILHALFLHKGEFLGRMELVEYLWENQVYIDDNTLSVHVARIREKLRTLGIPDFIETRRGVGYRI